MVPRSYLPVPRTWWWLLGGFPYCRNRGPPRCGEPTWAGSGIVPRVHLVNANGRRGQGRLGQHALDLAAWGRALLLLLLLWLLLW
jgi:hypothetical protein